MQICPEGADAQAISEHKSKVAAKGNCPGLQPTPVGRCGDKEDNALSTVRVSVSWPGLRPGLQLATDRLGRTSGEPGASQAGIRPAPQGIPGSAQAQFEQGGPQQMDRVHPGLASGQHSRASRQPRETSGLLPCFIWIPLAHRCLDDQKTTRRKLRSKNSLGFL